MLADSSQRTLCLSNRYVCDQDRRHTGATQISYWNPRRAATIHRHRPTPCRSVTALQGQARTSCPERIYPRTFNSQFAAIAASFITKILNGPLTAVPRLVTMHSRSFERHTESKPVDDPRTAPFLKLSLRVSGRCCGSLRTNLCEMAGRPFETSDHGETGVLGHSERGW